MLNRIAIVGLGLMGGSLGLAAKARKLARSVAGSARRAETQRKAVECGAVDEAFPTPAGAVAGADLVVFCLPVLSIPDAILHCREHLSPGAVVTDVGSTKVELIAAARDILKGTGVHVVGSHPIAGSDAAGFEAARADLYEGAVCVVTDTGAEAAAIERTCDFWTALGMQAVVMSAERHDHILARTSHWPHLVAAMLVQCVNRDPHENVARFCGTGYRDSTRIAGASERVWTDIVRTNRAALKGELDAFAGVLDRVRTMLDKNDFEGIERFLVKSREHRRQAE